MVAAGLVSLGGAGSGEEGRRVGILHLLGRRDEGKLALFIAGLIYLGGGVEVKS